jgi:sugar phosphate permease
MLARSAPLIGGHYTRYVAPRYGTSRTGLGMWSAATPVDVLLGRRRVYYGWWLLAASVGAMALGSGVSLWAFGLYVGPLEREFGWSRSEVSLAFSISLLISGLCSPLVGRWVDWRGPRSAIIVGSIATAATYVLLATTEELWQWYAYSSVNAVARQLMFFIPFMALISRWFDRRRGIAVSILGTGFSLGGFLVLPLMGLVIEAVDWRGALVVSAAAVAAVFTPIGIFVVRNSPADIGAPVEGMPQSAGEPSMTTPATGVTLREALRLPLFWTLSIALTLFFFGMFGWLVHQVPFYEANGISRLTAATIVSVAAGLSIVSRLAVGLIADRVTHFEQAALVLAASLMAGMVTLLISTGPVAIGVFLLFWIIGTAGGPMMEALLLTRAFGIAHFGTILGAVAVVETLGQIISPTLAGAIYDTTGSYDWMLVLFLGTFAGAFALFLVAMRLPRPLAADAVATPVVDEAATDEGMRVSVRG